MRQGLLRRVLCEAGFLWSGAFSEYRQVNEAPEWSNEWSNEFALLPWVAVLLFDVVKSNSDDTGGESTPRAAKCWKPI